MAKTKVFLLWMIALLCACTTPAAPRTPAPRPALTVEPQISLEPATGGHGTVITVNGMGWQPGATIFVKLTDETGHSGILAAGQVRDDGIFSTNFVYPTSLRWGQSASQTVVVETADASLSALTTFIIESPVIIAQATATPTVTVTATISSPPPSATVVTVTATATPFIPGIPVGVQPRPSVNGVFLAQPGAPSLDGLLDEWAGDWTPISNVVFGGASYVGPGDASGEFQVRWTQDGIYLAIRVRDDVYRSGPDGTAMWQGDGLEIHFDGQLALDYDSTNVNEDDYQVGVSFGPNLNELRGYRWLPADREGAFGFIGTVQPTADGYQLELILPWYILDVTPDRIFAQAAFGFNLSISDNDADTLAQQTIVSASPARTDHRTPPEWGTLVLR